MTCKHCQQPIQRCPIDGRVHARAGCKGWRHSANGYHACDSFTGPVAEPEPGTLPVTEAPASKPKGAVA